MDPFSHLMVFLRHFFWVEQLFRTGQFQMDWVKITITDYFHHNRSALWGLDQFNKIFGPISGGSFIWTGSLLNWVSFQRTWTVLLGSELIQIEMRRASFIRTGTVKNRRESWKSGSYGLEKFQCSYRIGVHINLTFTNIFTQNGIFSGSSKVGIVMSRASKTKSVNETRNDSKIKNRRRKSKSSHW